MQKISVSIREDSLRFQSFKKNIDGFSLDTRKSIFRLFVGVF